MGQFENDVKMYGTETASATGKPSLAFENDVKMYGTETQPVMSRHRPLFENDVKMYGTETIARVFYRNV